MEKFKEIPSFEGLYAISDLGNVKNLRTDQIMKTHDNGKGYLKVRLTKDKKYFSFYVHRLILLTFIGLEEGKVVDHINGVRNDNRLLNLRYLSNRDNTIRGGKKNCKSNLRGVAKDGERFRSTITIEGKRYFLGRFDTEQEAHEVYMKRLKELENESRN